MASMHLNVFQDLSEHVESFFCINSFCSGQVLVIPFLDVDYEKFESAMDIVPEKSDFLLLLCLTWLVLKIVTPPPIKKYGVK